MYLIPRDEVLTDQTIIKLIQAHNTEVVPRLKKLQKYYDGKQSILDKVEIEGKPCNKIVTNYCYNITQNYLGYLIGKPVTYSSEEDIEDILDVLNYNDVNSEDSDYLKNALIYGKAFEICYIDLDGKQRFRLLPTTNCIDVYSDDLNNDLLYVIYYYKETLKTLMNEDVYRVVVYSATDTQVYDSTMGWNSLTPLEQYPNYYNQIPITVFKLNTDESSIYEQIMSLQDAYNNLLSAEVDDFDSFADAYMLLKGFGSVDENDLVDMKRNRVLLMDSDCDASYLTKSVTDTQIQNMLNNISDQIYRISNAPDLSNEKFVAQSGIALKLRLVGFENVSSAIQASMKMALQKRIELICSILNLSDGDEVWRDIDITFTRNLPLDIADLTNTVNALRGLVSTKTLLGQIPFVTDVDAELEAVEKEKVNNMSLYSFADMSAEEETEEEETEE